MATAPTTTIATVAALLGNANGVAPAAAAPHPAFVDSRTVMRHPVYSVEYLESIKPKYRVPETRRDRVARATILAARTIFDKVTGYHPDRPFSECGWLKRMIVLETVAGVPGMVAGTLRHLRSLRLITYDKGWINTLLEEAENERLHLMTFMELKKPGPLFRAVRKWRSEQKKLDVVD